MSRSARRAAPHRLLDDIVGQVDLVLIDAPCTGIGAWRRNPDAKWRVRPGALEQRIKDQDEVLARAAPLVRQGGRIAYITCSLLAEENGDRVAAFLAAHAEFAVAGGGRDGARLARAGGQNSAPRSSSPAGGC